ncbi:MAG: S-layer homology domain-containing protein, partial [Anaerolineales bacterium]|nr:S-layer homology domain-containing protein [Anaerolineales bacterium]
TGELLAEGIAVCPKGLAVNPADGSCWVAATPDEVLHIAHDGAMLSRSGDRTKAFGVSVDQNDGSCWVAQEGVYIIYTSPPAGAAAVGPAPMSIIHGQWVVHLASDGTELWHDDLWPSSVSASSSDGTCWMASRSGSVSHWGPDGTQVSGTGAGWLVAADQTDGSCWVGADDAIVHLGADGTELWRGPAAGIRSLSVNSSDGSCWVGTNTEVIHLGADGTELWRGSGFNARSVSVDPADGSCWVADAGAGQVVHLAADGTPLCRGGLFDWTRTYDPGIPGKRSQLLAADPSDGSCWVADTAGGNLVRVAQRPGFPDVPPDFWSYAEIEACVDQRIVFGYLDGLYHPEIEVTRDQMAVYIARALVRPSGVAGIPDPEPPPTFPDVLPDFWAYRQIEYAVSQNVVQGYPDGTYQPSLVVDRGQMAVYIARAMVAPTGDAVIADPEPPYTFPDVPGDDNAWAWCHKHVEFLAGREVVQGYPDGLYHPENAVTRDQMAVYIARAFELPM